MRVVILVLIADCVRHSECTCWLIGGDRVNRPSSVYPLLGGSEDSFGVPHGPAMGAWVPAEPTESPPVWACHSTAQTTSNIVISKTCRAKKGDEDPEWGEYDPERDEDTE